MCEQGETIYNAGDVVWVKMGSVWWPAEVMDQEKLSPDVIPAFKKPLIAIVKFFQEDMYEYIKKDNAIFKYQCAKKIFFIKKGLDMYRAKQVHMEKFPEDIIRAERATGGDTEILTRDVFQEVKRERHSGTFGDATNTSAKKGQSGKSKNKDVARFATFSKMKKSNVEYKAKILVQGSQSSPVTSTVASTSRVDTCTLAGDSITTEEPVKPVPVTPTTAPGLYSCHSCAFTTSRLNTMIMHNRSHSVTAPSYIPSPVPKNHKTITPTKPQKKKIVNITKTPKIRKPKKVKIVDSPKRKRAAEEQLSESIQKKSKTDEEIKSSLLADWDDEWVEEEQTFLTDAPETRDVLVESQLPLDPVVPESESSNNIEILKDAQNGEPSDEKPAKDSRYEFCEEEDWPLETDVGRKIPRVKNLPKQKTDSRVIDDESVAREVSDLLEKTTLPELPSVPEPLKVEANFPEPSVIKSPDKTIFLSNECSKSPIKIAQEETQGKTIFKTKTFFRSRHSRSQDAIEKYIAEQLNATEKIDSLDSDINVSDATSSPEGRESPTVEPVKVVRLAPKIQLKKMKAESQLKEMSMSKNYDNNVLTSSNAITDVSSDGFRTDTSKHQLPSTNIGENELAHRHQQILDKNTADLNINDRSSVSKIDQELSDIQEIVLGNVQTSVDLNMVKSDSNSDTGEKPSDIQEHILNVQTSANLRATSQENILDNVQADLDNVQTSAIFNAVDSRSDIKTCEGLTAIQEKILYNVEIEASRGHIAYTGEEIMEDQYDVKAKEHFTVERGYEETAEDKIQISDNLQAAANLNIVDSIGDEQSNIKEQVLSEVQTSANFNTIVSGSFTNTVDLAKTSEELPDIQELILGNVQTSVELNTADNSSVTDTVEELLNVQEKIFHNVQAATDLNAIDGSSIINADNELSGDQEQTLDNIQVPADLNAIDGSSIINAHNELSGGQEQMLDNVQAAADMNIIDGGSINADNELSGDQEHVLDNVHVPADLNAINGSSIINADNELSGDQEQTLDNIQVPADLNAIDGSSIINADNELSGNQEQILDNIPVPADLNASDGSYILNADHELSGDQEQTLDNIQVPADLNAIDGSSIINADNELSSVQEQILDNIQVPADLNAIDGSSILNANNELSGDQAQILNNVQAAADFSVVDADSTITANNELSGDQKQILDNVQAAADLNVIDGGSVNSVNELSGDQEQILNNVQAAADLNVVDADSTITANNELSVDHKQILNNVQAAVDLNVIDGGSINADNELSGDQKHILKNVQAAADLNVVDADSTITANNELSGDQEQILDNVQTAADLNVIDGGSINADNELSGDQEHILNNVQAAADLNVVDADSTITANNELLGDQEQILSNVHTFVNLNTIDSGSITSTVDFMLHSHGKKQVLANLNTVYNSNENKLSDIKKSIPEGHENNLQCHFTVSQLATVDSSKDSSLHTKKINIFSNDKNVSNEVSMTHHTLTNVSRKDNINFKVNNGDDLPTDINNMKDVYFNNEMLQECTKQLNPISSHVTSAPTVHELLCAAIDSDRVPKTVTNDLPEDLFEEDVKCDNLNDIVTANGEEPTNVDYSEIAHEGECVIEEVVTSEDVSDSLIEMDTISNNNVTVLQSKDIAMPLQDNVPSESDLQVAEALITLPSTHNTELKSNEIIHSNSYLRNNIFLHEDKHTQLMTKEEPVHIQNSFVPNDTVHKERQVTKSLFEIEKEKSENLNAAQLLVEMSETVDHKLVKMEDHDNVGSFMTVVNHTATSPADSYVNVRSDSLESKTSTKSEKKKMVCTKSTSKLLQVLEKPLVSRTPINRPPSKTIRVTSNEKIINFEVNKLLGGTSTPSSQKIVLRKPANKNIVGPSKETLVLSRSKSQEGSSVQTYTIQTTPEPVSEMNIIIQQRLKNVSKPPAKIQRIKPVSTILGKAQDLKIINNCKNDSTFFDINSMPVVLSDDIVTPENIEKLPIVMSDGNIIKNPTRTHKVTSIIKHVPTIKSALIKPEVKTNRLFQVTATESNVKSPIPNILSKSSNVRNTKQMFIHDKPMGKQTMVVPQNKTEQSSKNIIGSTKTTSGQHQVKGEKYIVLQKGSAPKPVRQQKIVIDPKSGKAHVILPKTSEAEKTPVSAKLVSSVSNTGTSGTVMIITNAQGSQSRIVLTSEHEKILFPNNQHFNLAQLKTVGPQRPVGRVSQTIISPVVSKPSKLVPKEKTIITSKGQLIVGGRLTTTQTIAPKPESRPARRFITVDPSKSAPQRSSSEPLIFLQQKSGSIMQLTQSQFENLQKSGQLFKKPTVQPVIKDNKIVVQKSVTLNPSESIVPVVQKQRARAARPSPAESPLPKKKPRLEPVVATVPARAQYDPTPAFDNFEELLPSTAIARQADSSPLFMPAPEPAPIPEPAPCSASSFAHVSSPAAAGINEPEEPVLALNDGNLLAVPGEHFGGPVGSFYLCIEDCGTLTPLDNRPLMLENNQLVPMGGEEVSAIATQPERRDILEAALANSDVFRPDATRDEAPDFRDLNTNVSVHCRVSETSSTLHQPIMSPQELPSTSAPPPPPTATSLEAGLAVIGVTPHAVPTSLELPITVTDPRIAPRAPDPLSFGAPISMPLLTDEDDAVGKSMPILTDDMASSHA